MTRARLKESREEWKDVVFDEKTTVVQGFEDWPASDFFGHSFIELWKNGRFAPAATQTPPPLAGSNSPTNPGIAVP